MSLTGKTAVVTGGGSGIGRACAIRLARDGARVGVWDLNLEGAKETVAAIVKENGEGLALLVDCANTAAIKQGADKTRAAFGPVAVLVNNAGMTGFMPFDQITEEMWDRMIAVNLKGPFLCVKEMLPDMMAANWGRIVNISSSSTQTGAPAMAHYVASKGGVIGFTKALALELAAKNITVNNVPPGFVMTPMLKASPIDVEAYAKTLPMQRHGHPEDIAEAVAYLASPAANYVTGHTLSVNGGRYMN